MTSFRSWPSFALTVLACAMYPQLLHAQPKEPVPFKMRLLGGYHIEPSSSRVDTRCGEIKKLLGAKVQYDMGGDLPRVSPDEKPVQDWKRECSWREGVYSTKTSGTGDVDCYVDDLTNGKHLYVAFPDRTWFYVRIKNEKEVQRFLKMLLTYDPSIEH